MRKFLLGLLGGISLLALMVFLAAGWVLRASLPILDGEYVIASEVLNDPPALSAEVVLLRDAQGHPTVQAENFEDLAFGLGFLHAQDRFFQMDLSRRLAAGELAALVGVQAITQDRQTRVFRLRQVAREVIAAADPAERAWIEAYTRGVNEGLAALGSKPWEYHLLRHSPQPWRAEDSILVIHAMWWQLQAAGLKDEMPRRRLEARLEGWYGELPAADPTTRSATMALLYPRANDWDTPNFSTRAEAATVQAREASTERTPLPTAQELDLRERTRAQHSTRAQSIVAFRNNEAQNIGLQNIESDESGKPGSNAWAVSGPYAAAGGAALIAGDMHLGLRVPTVWYRARLQTESLGGAIDLNGVTLPGLPAVAAGSNGHVAWSFTNSYGDWVDVRGYVCDATGYETGASREIFESTTEMIEIAHQDPQALPVRSGPHGIVIAEEDLSDGRQLCWLARWLITQPGATNLRSLALQQVTSLDAALQLAPEVGIPHQNFIVGDRAGRIAWTIIGRIPVDPRGPESPTPILWRESTQAPRIVDPEVGRLWSANSRHVEGELERVLGNDEALGGMFYDTGVRARQIRDRLLSIESAATPDDMLSIQLEDRAELLVRWQALLVEMLDEEALAAEPRRAEYLAQIKDWGARAAADSIGYRIVRAFRLETRRATWNMLVESLGVEPGDPPALFEGSLWQLVTEQPPHLLADTSSATWREFLLQRLDTVIQSLDEVCTSLSQCRWGDYNTTRIRHPLSSALGPMAAWLDYPERPQHGDMNVPRVTGPNFGASERFAVAPGQEQDGFMHLPGGASGHPLSPFYRGSFEDWVSGKALPFLPGDEQHRLRLIPVMSPADR